MLEERLIKENLLDEKTRKAKFDFEDFYNRLITYIEKHAMITFFIFFAPLLDKFNN